MVICSYSCLRRRCSRPRFGTTSVEWHLAIVDPLLVVRLGTEPLLRGASRLNVRKLFKDNPPLRLSDNLATPWCNICHVPTGMCEVDWHNPPQRLWYSGFQARSSLRRAMATSADSPREASCW